MMTSDLFNATEDALLVFGRHVAKIEVDRDALLEACKGLVAGHDIDYEVIGWECRWCGVQYGADAAKRGYCTSPDCVGASARDTIAEAEKPWCWAEGRPGT